MSDSLVFYMCEYDTELNISDMQTFVLYDFKTSTYLIYGHRKSVKKSKDKYKPFYFRANRCADVLQFLSTIVDNSHTFTYALYALNELPVNADDINFEMLYERIQSIREIVAMDNQYFSSNVIENYINLTRKIYSMYDVEDEYEYDDEDF